MEFILFFQAVSVHCACGRGRTGTMLACYFVKHNGLSADNAIRAIRRLRPGSIDTEKQINAVQQYAQLLNQQ
jgi:atypical dual specificity phosphatase